ncbi:MAG: MFS transporter [Roseburia sp.]|nr:MFS transporter [Roseburia sp.]MCM1099396.1 MFS transporter [Ruminococcus flavefaciens]
MTKSKTKAKDPADRLGLGRLLAWKSSDVASGAVFVVVNSYLALYCTNYLGMDPAVVGMILLVSNIIDAITDLIACYVVDNAKITKWGKARPYELGIIGVWVCTILMFCTPESWNQTLKVIWIFFMYTFAFGVFNTFRAASMNPYMIRAFNKNRKVIGKLASFGGPITMVGSMIVSMSFPILMGRIATSAAGWRSLILLYGVPMLLLCLPRFLFIKENPAVDAGIQYDKVSLKTILQMILKNKYVWFNAGTVFLFNVVTSLGVLSYYFTYVVGNTDLMGVFSAVSFMIIPLMLFMPLFLRRFSAPQIVMGASAIAVVGYGINFLAGANFGMLILGGILAALASLPISYLGGLIVMDICTYNEYLDLPRMDASTAIISNNFASQIGQGVGGALLGVLLSASGFISTTEGIVAQPESAVTMIRMLYSLIPMVLMIALVVCAIGLSSLNKKLDVIEGKTKEE